MCRRIAGNMQHESLCRYKISLANLCFIFPFFFCVFVLVCFEGALLVGLVKIVIVTLSGYFLTCLVTRAIQLRRHSLTYSLFHLC